MKHRKQINRTRLHPTWYETCDLQPEQVNINLNTFMCDNNNATVNLTFSGIQVYTKNISLNFCKGTFTEIVDIDFQWNHHSLKQTPNGLKGELH